MSGRYAPVTHFFYRQNQLQVEGCATALCGYRFADGEGIFNHWQVKDNSAEISNDYFGFRPLYYKAAPGHLWLSEDINALIEPGEPVNYAALAVFLRSGDFLAQHTAFANIQTLAPNSSVRFDQQGMHSAVRAKLSAAAVYPDITALKQAYKECFSDSVRKLSALTKHADVVVPLSGGRDSRHILLELHAQRYPALRAVTIKHQPPKSNEDFQVASLLATHLGVSHQALAQQLPYHQAELTKNTLTSYSALEHAWFLPLAQYLGDTQSHFVFDGVGGDVLATGSARLTAQRHALALKGSWEALADELLGPEGYLPAMLSPELAKRLSREVALEQLTCELSVFAGAANPVAQFYFWHRARRTIGSSAFGLLGRQATTLAPFLDTKLYALQADIPAEFFLQHGSLMLHDAIIAESYPRSAHIRYEDMQVQSDNQSYFLQRCLENWQQFSYLLLHKPQGIRLTPLLTRLPKRLLNAAFHYRSAYLVRTALYLHSLEQITQDGLI